MSSERPSEATIFNTAREIVGSDERRAYLDLACGADAKLRERIENLLAAYAEESEFLEQPAIEQATILQPSENDLAASLEAGLAQALGKDAAVVVGSAGHSILKSLGHTIDVPHVALREPKEEGPEPITRPQSPEMPKSNSDSRYQLQGEIARGGMGAILKGRDTDLERDLAIKVLLDQHKDKPEVIQRFVEEAQIGGQLQHPGIAPIYELGQFKDKRPFFAMKLVKGETLSKLLAERENPAEDRGRFIGIFEQVCQTMAYAHSRGVIHRDLKPANIMVGAFGEVQVMDWGLAKVLPAGGVADEKKAQDKQQGQSVIHTLRSGVGSDVPGTFGTLGSQTQMGSVIGTPAYMPPEQALGEIDNMDERADVFGLGAILCEILTGKPPYVGDDGTQVYRMASRGKLDDAFKRLDGCGADADLIALTKKCLEVEPEDRPRDAGVLAERVAHYLESVETKLRETEIQRAAEAARIVEERKRRRVTLALVASVLLLLGLSGGTLRYVELQQADRQASAAARVNEALGQARLYESLADEIDPASERGLDEQVRELDQAVQSATEAVKLAEEEHVAAPLQATARELASQLEQRTNDVRDLARQAAADRALRKELERIRLSQSGRGVAALAAVVVHTEEEEEEDLGASGAVGWLDAEAAASLYAAAFRQADLDLAELSVDTAAQRIKASGIRESLIAALDDWTRALTLINDAESSRPSDKKLLAIADAADDSPWRKQVRTAVAARDIETLQKLTDDEDTGKQSPALAAWVGAALRDAGRDSQSIRVLQAALLLRPADFWLNYELGQSLIRNGQKPEGIGYLRAATAIRPDSTGATEALALALRMAGQPEEAIREYRRALKFDPNDIETRRGLAWSLLEIKRYDEAETELRKAQSIDSTNVNVLISLGNVLARQTKLQESAEVLRKAMELDPANTRIHIVAGINNFNSGAYEQALTAFRKATELEPNNADAHVRSGHALRRLEKLHEAESSFRRAIQIDPASLYAHHGLANVLHDQGHSDQAIKLFRRAIEMDQRDFYAYSRIADIFHSQDKLDEALAWYRKANEIDPGSPYMHGRIASILERQGKSAEAAVESRRAAELDPSNPNNHIAIGTSHFNSGDYEQALAAFRKAVELDPELAYAHYQLGKSLQQLGEIDAAIASFKKALELNPQDEFARYYLCPLLLGAGHRDEAKSLLRQGLEFAPDSQRLQPILDNIDAIPGWVSSWSPSGEQLVFRIPNTRLVAVARADGSGRTILTRNATNSFWSPVRDGPIAIVRKINGVQYICLMDSNGENQRRLARGVFIAGWAPDGKRLFFRRTDNEDRKLYSLDTSAAAAEPEALMELGSSYVAVSPDGKLVADARAGRLLVIEIATGNEVAAWPIEGWNGVLPGWSPDSRYVGFGSLFGKQGLWILNVQRSEAFQAIPEEGTFPRWSPDGKRIAYDNRSGAHFIKIVDVANLPWPEGWGVPEPLNPQ